MNNQDTDFFSLTVFNAVWRHDETGGLIISAWDKFGLMDFTPGDGLHIGAVYRGELDDAYLARLISEIILEVKDQLSDEEAENCEAVIVTESYEAEPHEDLPGLQYQDWKSGWISVRCNDVERVHRKLDPSDSSAWRILYSRQLIRLRLWYSASLG